MKLLTRLTLTYIFASIFYAIGLPAFALALILTPVLRYVFKPKVKRQFLYPLNGLIFLLELYIGTIPALGIIAITFALTLIPTLKHKAAKRKRQPSRMVTVLAEHDYVHQTTDTSGSRVLN